MRVPKPVINLTGHADVILAMDSIFDPKSIEATGEASSQEGETALSLKPYLITASDDGIVKRFDVSTSP